MLKLIVGLGWSIKFSLFMLNWIQVKAIVHGMQAAGKKFSAATAIEHLVTLNGIQLQKQLPSPS